MPTQRLQYLHDASDLLIASSPAISARLRTVERKVAGEQGLATDQHKDRSCTACGNVLIPGWSCKIIVRNDGSKVLQGRPSKPSARSSVKTLKMQCLACNAITVTDSRKPPRLGNKTVPPPTTHVNVTSVAAARVDAALRTEAPAHATTISQAPATSQAANPITTSSRKARSKKSSLQALLAGQQQGSAGPATKRGYELKDFMKG